MTAADQPTTEPTDADVAAFCATWAEPYNAAAPSGERTRAGLRAVFAARAAADTEDASIVDAETLARAIEENVGAFDFNGQSFLATDDVVAFIRERTTWRPDRALRAEVERLRALVPAADTETEVQWGVRDEGGRLGLIMQRREHVEEHIDLFGGTLVSIREEA